jgi:hypothetical protein
MNGTCVDEDCVVGANGCPCTNGGACDADLVCEDDICMPSGGGTSASTDGPTSSGGSSPTTDGGSGETGEPADLDAWSKRRPVLISNPNDADMVEYQAKVDIDWDDDMNADLSDLRFTDADGVLLPHWIEDFVAPVSGRIWVRVPLVPADDETTIYMWYGNDAADDASDGAAVFDLWEDFEADLDETLWTSTDGHSVAGGVLSIGTGAVYSIEPMVELPGLILEIRARWSGGGGGSSGLTAAESQGAIGDQDLLQITQAPLHFTAVDGTMTIANENWTNPPGEPGDQFEWHGLGMGEGLVRFSRTHEYIDNFLWWHDFNADIPNEYYLWLGHAWGSLAESEPTQAIEIDVLLGRKFAELPNETSVGGEEDV